MNKDRVNGFDQKKTCFDWKRKKKGVDIEVLELRKENGFVCLDDEKMVLRRKGLQSE